MSDEHAHADGSHVEEQPAGIPSEDDVTALLSTVQSFVQTYQAHQVEVEALRSKLAAAESRAQNAERLLRKLYSATIGYFGSPKGESAPAISGEQGEQSREAYAESAAA